MNMPHTYIDYLELEDRLSGYAAPRAKLTWMRKKGEIVRVRRGLYVPADTSGVSLFTLANKIYGPSYVSFESALAHHGLIPERVATVTSASMGKNKSKLFQTPLGAFSYRSVPAWVYPYGVIRVHESDSPYLMATAEKALCDLIAKRGMLDDVSAVEHVLFDDLRLDRAVFLKLDARALMTIAGLYRKRSVQAVAHYARERKHHAGS